MGPVEGQSPDLPIPANDIGDLPGIDDLMGVETLGFPAPILDFGEMRERNQERVRLAFQAGGRGEVTQISQ